ncbi:PadR family transcriptional regulator [Aquipuribacter nitratireducens]|uniref:PadR family transcriptional regulator n=1 Tax=Aquipuribacter nitratireducens TaxID=650104 RepID=A0ABW0GMS8_9MICO
MPRRTDVIELAVLGVLDDAPMHGYHLRKHVTALLGPWRAALSFGTLYPTLRRLQARGWVAASEADPAGPVRAGTSRSAHKVVYELTPAGRERFRELLTDPGAPLSDDDAFAVRFAFFARLGPDERVRVLEQRLARLLDRLASVRRDDRTTTVETRDPYRRAWVQRGVASVEAELRWTEQRLAAEREAHGSGPRPQPQSPRAAAIRRTADQPHPS